MTECPTADQLQRLLDGVLPGSEQGAVEAHIDRCSVCQYALDKLTAGPSQAEQSDIHPSAATFIARVRALSPGTTIDARATPAPPKPMPPPDVPGYTVECEIGRGGMGVVYRARHRRLNRLVALKMLTDVGLTDATIRVRLLVEAETVAQLRHPHVVQVYEFGDHAGRPYLALEYVDGGNLAERLERGDTFTPVRAAELVAKLADGVAAAHAKGIIHRDLKPSNILLATVEGGGGKAEEKNASGSAFPPPPSAFEPKVADFGIARVGRSEMTATGEVLGTPAYMAPEQAAGRAREVGTATDVYGLGTILYELLAGQPPFDNPSVVETLQQVVHQPPRPPRAVSRGVPRDLDTICLKCLEKDPKKRYPTAHALAADLRAYLDGRTIAARPARAWERAVRFARRNPVPVAALLLVSATALGALVWVEAARRVAVGAQQGEAWSRDRAEDNEKAAVAARRAAELGAARAAFDQAVSLCEAGDVDRGLVEFARARELAERAGGAELAAVIHRNAVAWEAHRPRELRRFDAPDPARPVTATALADDGKLFVTGSRAGGPVRVWPLADELPDGQAVWELTAPPGAKPGVVGLFPAADARLLVLYESGHIGEWNLRTATLARVDAAFDPTSPIRSAGASRTRDSAAGRLVVAGLADGTARVWDMDRRALLALPDGNPVVSHRFLGPKKQQRSPDPSKEPPVTPGAVTGIGFADRGNMLLTAGETEGVVLYGLPIPNTGKLLDPWPGGMPDAGVPYHQFDLGGPVTGLLVSPGRQHFLAGGASAVSLWTIHDRERPVWVHGHPDRVTALAFSPDGALCASADRGGTVLCRDLGSGAFQAQLHLPSPVLSLQFVTIGERAVLVGLENGASALWRLPLHADVTARAVEPAPSGPGVVIRIGSNPEQAVHAVGFDPLRCGVWGATSVHMKFWASGSVERLVVQPNPGETMTAPGTAISADGRWAVFATPGRDTISVSGLTTQMPTVRRLPAAGVVRVGILDDTSFFTLSAEPEPGHGRPPGHFGWWERDADGGATRRATWPLAPGSVVAPHPDGKSVLVARPGDERIAFRDRATGRETGLVLRHAGATVLAVDPGGRWAATAGQDRGVRVWSLTGPTAGQLVERGPLHADRVNALAFGSGPSAGVLVTASSDGTARFWDAKTGYPLGPPLRHPDAVLSVAFDPTGERVITGGRSGYAKVWPAPKADGP